jgi:toxin ParE1/3/4
MWLNTTVPQRMIAATCNTVADSVLMGRARPDLPGSLRSFPKGHYVIYYRIVSDGIEVARVLHGARDIRRLF